MAAEKRCKPLLRTRWSYDKSFFPQAFDLSKAVVFGKAGFMVVQQSTTDIYEWEHTAEKFVLTPILQNGARDTAAVMGVSSGFLGC